MIFSIFALIVSMTFIGCSIGDRSGGSATETEFVIAVTIYTPDSSKFLEKIDAYIQPSDSIITDTNNLKPVEIDLTNGKGLITFPDKSKNYTIELTGSTEDTDVALITTVDAADSNLTLYTNAELGTVTGSAKSGNAIFNIPGTRHVASSTNNNNFLLSKLPVGDYKIVGIQESDTVSFDVVPGDTVPNINFSFGSALLLDNFENDDQFGLTYFESDKRRIAWFAYSDDMRVFPEVIEEDYSSIFTKESETNNGIIYSNIALNNYFADYAGIGVTLFELFTSYILTDDIEILFNLKGQGTIEFRVELVYENSEDIIKLTDQILLTENWQSYEIPLAALDKIERVDFTRKIASFKIIFYTIEDAEIFIDDLMLRNWLIK